MAGEEERNCCPDCEELVPLGEPDCPHCGRAPLKEFYAFIGPHLGLFCWLFFYMANGCGVSPFTQYQHPELIL